MVNCNWPNCKSHKTCNLREPMTPLTTEIRFWLKELRLAENRLEEYDELVKDIVQYHKYAIPVNVYGNIQYAPKQNAAGVFIRRPEHVMFGWNISRLRKNIFELTDKIRRLRLQEWEMIRYGNHG